MLDVISDHSLSQDLQSFLAIKLGAVDTDESDFWEVFEFGFKLLKLSQDVDTIDAAACPEVNDKDFAFELVIHGERLVIECVEPFEVVSLSQLTLECFLRVSGSRLLP